MIRNMSGLRKLILLKGIAAGGAEREHTVTGDVVSFMTNMTEPLKVDVALTPVQDLHGQDYPWVGGAGKNLFKTTLTSQEIRGVTFTVNSDGSISASNTATSNISRSSCSFGSVTLPAGTYKANGFAYGGSSIQRMQVYNVTAGSSIDAVYSGHEEITFTLSTESEISVNPIIASGLSTGFTFYPMIRLSTITDATFAPYENLCPITGHTGANVTRTGKNVLNLITMTPGKRLDDSTGELVVSCHR